jgi:uncharacterized protein (TIRG00374 family)
MKKNAKRWLFWLGLIISGVFLYFAFREINYRELWSTLREARLWWLAPGLVIYSGSMLVRAWRWGYLLNPVKKIGKGTLLSTILIGYMGNNVFPLRMGEVLRAVVLKRREDVPISASLATIVVERIFDAVVVVGFVLVNLSQLTRLPGTGALTQLGGLATWAILIFAVGLGVFIAVAMFPKPAMRLIHGLINKVSPERWRESLTGITDRFLDGLMSLRSPKDALMILLTSILVWLLETGLYWSVNRSLGLGFNFGQLMLLNGVVNMVLLIPAAPGGLGTFDAASRAMLQAYGIPAEPALGFTLILRIVLWVPITLVGAIFFVREGLQWTMDMGEIRAQGDQPQPGAEIEESHGQ